MPGCPVPAGLPGLGGGDAIAPETPNPPRATTDDAMSANLRIQTSTVDGAPPLLDAQIGDTFPGDSPRTTGPVWRGIS